MKAIVWTKYGPPDVLEYREVEKPSPKDNEVLIKIFATTVTAGDTELRSLKFPIYFSFPMRILIGFRRPRGTKIPGTELAGEIESVGKNVRLFEVGDQVFGSAGLRFGAHAEYICLPEPFVAIKPTNMTYDEAAAAPFGGREALHFLRLGNIQIGQKVLINGAGGSIGTFAIQLAKHLGAEVTGVDSTEKLEMLLSIGVDQVVDYTKEDFTTSGKSYDSILDVVGNLSPSIGERSLNENGSLLLANPKLSQMVGRLTTSKKGGKKIIMQTADPTSEDLVFLKELIEAGKIKSVIDRGFPLDQIREAHRYVEAGHKKGNLVITVEHNNTT
ncbi:MAG: NAD(P)-dependent alcohol dehydrogenase [Verrucomicrobia bacterium]|nr:NAD(P)-dependent alcohol dehydrogenase [Verrucomicrobiota bacterium]